MPVVGELPLAILDLAAEGRQGGFHLRSASGELLRVILQRAPVDP